MKLTTKGYYALQSILDLINHANGHPVRVEDIANRQKLSLSYLEQIFRNLRRAGIIKSVRGPGGGCVLARGIDEISLIQIFSAVNESLRYSDAISLPAQPTPESRQILFYFKQLDEAVFDELSAVTLAYLLNPNTKQGDSNGGKK